MSLPQVFRTNSPGPLQKFPTDDKMFHSDAPWSHNGGFNLAGLQYGTVDLRKNGNPNMVCPYGTCTTKEGVILCCPDNMSSMKK